MVLHSTVYMTSYELLQVLRSQWRPAAAMAGNITTTKTRVVVSQLLWMGHRLLWGNRALIRHCMSAGMEFITHKLPINGCSTKLLVAHTRIPLFLLIWHVTICKVSSTWANNKRCFFASSLSCTSYASPWGKPTNISSPYRPISDFRTSLTVLCFLWQLC